MNLDVRTSEYEEPPKSKFELILDRLVPDFRLSAAAATFALVFYLLHMIEANPALLKDSAFMGMSGLLVGSGGIGTVLAFAFGGTATGAKVMAAQSDAVIKQAASPPPPDSTTTTTTKTTQPKDG